MTPAELISPFYDEFSLLNNDHKQELLKNAAVITSRVSELLSAFGEDRKKTSGWRPESYNAQVGGAKNSKHIYCQAVDIEDFDGELKKWCLANLKRLEEIGIWMEDPSHTNVWAHFQSLPPKSGHRVFMP